MYRPACEAHAWNPATAFGSLACTCPQPLIPVELMLDPAMITPAIRVMADFEQALDRVRVITGCEETERHRDAILELAQTMPVSAAAEQFAWDHVVDGEPIVDA